jgi:hypothetical protein
MSRINELIAILGFQKACDILEAAIDDSSKNTLTIVSNCGVHHLPEELKRGEMYYASNGTMDFSSLTSVKAIYTSILSDLSRILKQKKWDKIYLVPFGHSTLSMQIKLLVFRITRIETTDLFYDGSGKYYDLDIELRPLITESKTSEWQT